MKPLTLLDSFNFLFALFAASALAYAADSPSKPLVVPDGSAYKGKKIIAKTNSLALADTAAVQGLGPMQTQAIQDLLLFAGAVLESDSGGGLDQGSSKEPDAVDEGGTRTANDVERSESASSDQGSQGQTKYKIAKTMAEIMDWLRGWGPVDYLEPDDLRELPEFGIKIYILGPSRKMRMLGGSSPSGQISTMSSQSRD